MARFSKNKMMLLRVGRLRKTVQINTQRLRGKALKALEELFNMAKKQAKNKELTIKQRQAWVRIAAYICQVVNSVAKGFDEKQIDLDLDKLEKLLNEAQAKNQDGQSGEEKSKTKGKKRAGSRKRS